MLKTLHKQTNSSSTEIKATEYPWEKIQLKFFYFTTFYLIVLLKENKIEQNEVK